MRVSRALCRLWHELPPEGRRALRHVRIYVRRRPGAVDLARGAAPDQRAYFYGVAPERDRGSRVAPLPDPIPALGEIVLFSSNMKPCTLPRIRTVFFHEVAHVLGYEEAEIVGEMGLTL